MTTLDEMDEFVDWDKAAEFVTTGGPSTQNVTLGETDASLDAANIGLVLANVDEDDFSFHALQHFAQSTNPADESFALGTLSGHGTEAMDLAEHTANPCLQCALGGYSCKKIKEGRFQGYCTSCVALNVECSFGGLDVNEFSTTNRLSLTGDHLISNSNLDLSSDVPQLALQQSSSSLDLLSRTATPFQDTNEHSATRQGPPPKIGARFSRESVKILKNWLSTHNRHPYPSDEEKEALQRQTGLNKTQITNWLANARRRGKVQPPRSTSPHVGNWAGPVDIPRRPGTPALESMNPLQRWQHSPPENEAASVTAIARAVTASSSTTALSSGLNSPYSFNYTDDGSSRSLCNQSSASSLGTSHSSNGSRGSAYSHGSRNSWGSFGSGPFSARGRRRRRRRATPNQAKEGASNLSMPLRTFQCTFCTETFRTKHDWQRHEKSLHLSLERWVCAPNGPRLVHPETRIVSCVFCGMENPSDEHIETHNHSECKERKLEERTFYRKDHLNQHLRLVHDAKFIAWSMKEWKVATPEIRSRCGFCGIVMDTWTIRTDHLAEHFKTGYSMADWKGDWGFDVPVLDMVENSIPPYLIHHERTSPLPYVPSKSPPETPRNAYDLIKLELAYFGANHQEQHLRAPNDDEMRLEGCRIIFASELLSLQGIATQDSWLRDLIMSDDSIAQKARFGPLRGAAESRLATLKINGKDNLFEECPMEQLLLEFVEAKKSLGLTMMDDELQEEACKIVGRVEEVCTHPSETIANWLLRLVTSSTDWLAPFRRRAHLPRSEDVQHETVRSKDPTSIDSTIHSYSRLERELADYLKQQRSTGVEATDSDLQRRARMIIYEYDDGWNQTAADNIQWLQSFRNRHPAESSPSTTHDEVTAYGSTHAPTESNSAEPLSSCNSTRGIFDGKSPQKAVNNDFQHLLSLDGRQHNSMAFFLNDANCYRRLAKELRRWVKSTMSPNNPNRHVPTDEELQYQARWILYDDDDPWNQTAADNAEWLHRFKRDAGILRGAGPGLPPGYAWSLAQGGTGFAPPYAYPKGKVEPFSEDVQVSMRTGSKPIVAGHDAANHFLAELLSENRRPANIFCSRELEAGLVQFVQEVMTNTGRFPSDADLQARARNIVQATETAADDPVLLGKFKTWVQGKVPGTMQKGEECPTGETSIALQAGNGDMNMTDAEVERILQDMDFEFDFDDVVNNVTESDKEGQRGEFDQTGLMEERSVYD